jgi:hypothetical protein
MRIHLIIFVFVLCSGMQSAAQDRSAENAVPLFSSHEIIHFTVKGDIDALINDVGDEREQHPTMLEYMDNGDTIKLDVQIRTRGNFRRNPDNCPFPPLRFNFKKKQVVGTLFEGVDKIKLVTHCRSNQKRYQHYVLKEYLVYRVFNLLTDTSLRVRLARITYKNPTSEKEPLESYAFFIEPDEVFEERFDAEESKQKYLFPDSTSYQHIGKVSFFHYMVGNTDWAVTTLHNIRLFTIYPDKPPYAVPYDFDWCGAVDAHYAVPLPRFGTESVTERIYRGQCRPMEEFMELADFFNTKRDDIYNLVDSFPLLPRSEKRKLVRYYKEFYKIINNERRLRSEIMGSCLRQD